MYRIIAGNSFAMTAALLVSAGGNKQHEGPAVNLAKLEQETEQFKGTPSRSQAAYSFAS